MKLRICLVLCLMISHLVLSCSSSTTEDARSDALFPIAEDELWGFINGEGEVVVEPKYEMVGFFDHYSGTAMIVIGDKSGYVDKSGNVVIEPQYSSAGKFSEGLAGVEIAGKWGYINVAGDTVISPQFDKALHFTEGFAAVNIGGSGDYWSCGGKWGYINKTGDIVVECIYDNSYQPVCDGYAIVTHGAEFFDTVVEGSALHNVRRGGKERLIDTQGRIIREFENCHLGPFRESRAAISFDYDNYGYIDSSGQLVIDTIYEFAGSFYDGIAHVVEKGHAYFIDPEGNKVFDINIELDTSPPIWFSEGLAAFSGLDIGSSETKFGYMNSAGEIVVKPRFDVAGSFEYGLAEVRIGNTTAYIDKEGEYVWRSAE
ncbi:MAG: WG repeat-containing protein [Proteobacteria bacterium]|nr:WG repeat-containing protein [Pseudomonadota bacterium]